MGAPGCDDAPVIDIEMMVGYPRSFTLIMPYYDNPQFLQKQIEGWQCLPAVLRDCVDLILVDDGSPDSPAIDVLRGRRQDINGVGYAPSLPFSTRLYRIDVDVRWNWLAARNIGAFKADDGWIMLTDMDHVLPEDTLRTLLFGQFDPATIYRFSRTESDGKKIHPHPNSWFMTRKMYWKIGGYDEALSGHYGTDGSYRRRCAATAPIRIMRNALARWEHYGDSSTVRYKRKQPEDKRGKELARKRVGVPPKVLSFPYHEEAIWN